MIYEVRLPYSTHDETVTVSIIHTDIIGSRVEAGQILMMVFFEEDKAVGEVATEEGGTIEEICVKNGDYLVGGQLLVRIRTDD